MSCHAPLAAGAADQTGGASSSGGARLGDGFISDHVRRTTRNLTIVGVLCLLAVGAVFALGAWRHYHDLLAGPFPLEHGTLLGMTTPDSVPHQHVHVTGDELIETGMARFESSRRGGTERESARYQAMPVGDKLLLIEAAPNSVASGTEATGWLAEVTPFIADEILEPLYSQSPESRGAFLPVMLKSNESRVIDYVGLALLVFTAAFGVWSLIKVAKRRARPESHPIYAALDRHGAQAEVAAAIDREAWAQDRTELKPVTLTPSWLLYARPFGLDALRHDDLVWAYEKVTQHSYNFIPTGKTYAVLVADRGGKQIEIGFKRKGKRIAPQLLDEIRTRAPWIICGYSDELATDWKKNPADVIAFVDERRAAERAS